MTRRSFEEEGTSVAAPVLPSSRPGANVGGALAHAARLWPGAPAVVDGTTRFDYATLAKRVGGLGAGLFNLGLEPGDVVAVLALNSHRHLECWLGVPRVGLVLNELNTRLAVAELAFIVDDSEGDGPRPYHDQPAGQPPRYGRA